MSSLQMTLASSIKSNNNFMSHALETSTNKRLLIDQYEEHVRILIKYKEIIMQKNGFCDVHGQTFGQIFNSSAHVLQDENRINLKTIMSSSKSYGKFLLCRILCPVLKLYEAFITIVDDPEGELGVRVQLSNVVRDEFYDSDEFLVGTILAIMNPSFRINYDGILHIRCDDPDEVLFLDKSMIDVLFPRLKWNGQLPKPKEFRRKNGNHNLSVNWKRIGDEHFAFNRYVHAKVAYTICIGESGNSVDLLCNRSASYWHLSNYEAAFIDAEEALAIDNTHIKAILRKVKALIGMECYDDVSEVLREIPPKSIPISYSKMINDLKKQASAFVMQSKYGLYPWKYIHIADLPLELANYTNNVSIMETTKKGRGLFANKLILAGELILVSKAFAHTSASEKPMNKNNGTEFEKNYKSHSPLALDIAKILRANPEKCIDLFCLYAGPKLDYLCACECNEAASILNGFPIDMQRIESICAYNAFSDNIRSFNNNFTSKSHQWGIWIIPSFLNHSCIANASWFRVQNYLFVKAFRSIGKGEEIMISYEPPYFESFRRRSSYDFDCDCRACEREHSDDESKKIHREVLTEDFFGRLATYHPDGRKNKKDEKKLFGILKLLRQLRDDAPELNFILVQPLLQFGIRLSISTVNSQMEKAIYILEECFRIAENIAAYNFTVVTACVHIISTSLRLKKYPETVNWIEILRKRAFFAYGSLDILDGQFPNLRRTITEAGFIL